MIEPKYKPGDRVIVTVADDMFTGHSATIRSWKRRNKPPRIAYTLDIDGKGMKWGAGPYTEDELTKETNRVNITQITVSYGETQSLPEYSNVKPNLTITAVLDQGDDPEAIEAALWTLAKSAVREQIDLALEGSGKAAKWSDEPRYQVLKTTYSAYLDRGKTPPARLVVILPDRVTIGRDEYGAQLVSAAYDVSRKLRYTHALRVAHEVAEGYDGAQILDCSNGDLAPLAAALPPAPAELPVQEADLGGPGGVDLYAAAFEEDDDLDEDEE